MKKTVPSVADSLYSAVWSVNVRTREVTVAIDDITRTTNAELANGMALGINSLRMSEDN